MWLQPVKSKSWKNSTLTIVVADSNKQLTHTRSSARNYMLTCLLRLYLWSKSANRSPGEKVGGKVGAQGGLGGYLKVASVVCKRRVQSQSWRRCYQLLYVFFLLSPLTHWPLRSPLAQGSQQFDGGFSDQRKGRCVDRGQCRCHITSMEGVLPPLSELTERWLRQTPSLWTTLGYLLVRRWCWRKHDFRGDSGWVLLFVYSL